jgi:two-component system, cell cycle sensor histidine kinase and response regulator CckA
MSQCDNETSDLLDGSEPRQTRADKEASFRHIYSLAPVMMHSIDKNRVIRNVNNKWLTHMGYSRDQVIGRTIEAFLTPESAKVLSDNFPDFWKDKRVSDVSYQYVRSDGGVIDVLVDAVATQDHLWGEISISIVRDVTEQKRAEEAIRRSEEKYRLLFDHAPVGIISIDQEGRILEINRKLLQILGSSSLEGSKSLNVLTHPRLVKSGMADIFRYCLDHGQITQVEVPYESEWGKLSYMSLILTPIAGDDASTICGCQAVVEDITERREAEQSLWESEERYRLLTRYSLTGICIFQDSRFVYVNDRLADMLGYTPEEMIGQVFWHVVHPEDRHILRGKGRDVSIGPAVIPQYEFRVCCKDGQTKWFEVLSTDITYRGRSASMCNVADITDRKRAAADLARVQSLLVAAIEQSPAGILIADAPDGKICMANPAALGLRSDTSGPMTDIPLELDPTAWRVFHPDGSLFETEALPLWQAIKSGLTSQNVEAVILRPDGTERWVLTNAAPVKNEGGDIIAGVAVLSDITDRKRTEDALRQSQDEYRTLYEESSRREELYRSLLDSSPDAVVVYDLEGRAQYVNDSFTRTFGWTMQEVKGRRIQFLPDSERKGTLELIRQVVRDGVPCTGYETKRYTKDGRIRDMSISASRYHDHQGGPAGMLVVLSDITERKRLEGQLRQAARMEAIGQLAGGVAHDFNNILTAIMGYANILLEQPNVGDERNRGRVVQIAHAAERAAALTRQLLAFGRKQMLDVRVLDLNTVVSDFQKILRRLIGEHIELQSLLDPSLATVRADPSQIEQILMNLAVNARDAMPNGGQLTIETANVVFDLQYVRTHAEVTPGPYAVLTVSDTGRGMDAETRARIFDPFFTTKEKGVGTGLGLSTVYGIVKQHQGHIEVYSEPGRGTTFRVYLPAVQASVEEVPKALAPQGERCGTETVLVVEDEEIVRGLACEALEMLGYVVLQACSPQEAMQVCSEHECPIDLLFTDVVLPQMDGRSLFERISPLYPAMKVLYVSGYTEDFVVRQGVLDRGVQFLQKPFTLNNLAAKIREVLDEPPHNR